MNPEKGYSSANQRCCHSLHCFWRPWFAHLLLTVTLRRRGAGPEEPCAPSAYPCRTPHGLPLLEALGSVCSGTCCVWTCPSGMACCLHTCAPRTLRRAPYWGRYPGDEGLHSWLEPGLSTSDPVSVSSAAPVKPSCSRLLVSSSMFPSCHVSPSHRGPATLLATEDTDSGAVATGPDVPGGFR